MIRAELVFFVLLLLSYSARAMQIDDSMVVNSEMVLPAGPPEPPFMEVYPHLNDYIYKEPSSGLFFGIGASPVGMVADRMMFAIHFFQLHYISKPWDIEVFSAGYGFTQSGDADLNSDHFTFRMSPKFQVTTLNSVGPLIGYELVSFQNIEAKLYKAPSVTPDWEPFSTRGFIFGAMVSQTFAYKKAYLFRINEVLYQQTYSVTETKDGWGYLFKNEAVQSDRSRIEGGYVAAVEFSILY